MVYMPFLIANVTFYLTNLYAKAKIYRDETLSWREVFAESLFTPVVDNSVNFCKCKIGYLWGVNMKSLIPKYEQQLVQYALQRILCFSDILNIDHGAPETPFVGITGTTSLVTSALRHKVQYRSNYHISCRKALESK